MSKIFEALNRGNGDISEIALSSVSEAQMADLQALDSDGAAMLAAAISPAPQPANGVPEAAAPISTRASAQPSLGPGVRTISLRLPGTTPLLPFDGDHWHASEQYRMVRTKLLHHVRQPRLIVVSSAGSGDGKSVTAVNLAGALSLKTESKVLLVDADFRRSTIHTQLGLDEGPGLAEVLRGNCTLEEAVIRTEQMPNFPILTAGENKSNPVELLDSSRWPALCARLRETFRYVVLDSPPIAAVADYDLIQAACDGVVVVLRPDHTNRKLCNKALQVIPKEKLIGLLLNCVTDWFLGKYGSAYYYQSYGRYEQAR
jgi:capsular exopolysaccharide synthesis family protein